MKRSIILVMVLLLISCYGFAGYIEDGTYEDVLPCEEYIGGDGESDTTPPIPVVVDSFQVGNMAYLKIYNNGNAEIEGGQDLYQKTQMESAVIGHTQYISGITELNIGEDIILSYDSSTNISTLAPIVNLCARDITINALCNLRSNNLNTFRAVNKAKIINIPDGVGTVLGSSMFCQV